MAKVINKCSNCNDYGVDYKYMTHNPTNAGQFCSCDFGKLRKKEYMASKKCGHSERVGNYCEHCETGGYVSKVEAKLKKMAGF